MHGNAWDTCLDYFANMNEFYKNDYTDSQLDPSGPATNAVSMVSTASFSGTRVLRGGSYGNGPADCCSGMRYQSAQSAGRKPAMR